MRPSKARSCFLLSARHGTVQGVRLQLCEPANIPLLCAPVQVAERVNAAYLWILAPKEHEKGLVRRKNLDTREEEDILLADLYEDMRNHEHSEQENDPYSDFKASLDQAEATDSEDDDVPAGHRGADRSAENLHAGAETNSSNGSSSDSKLHSAGHQLP